MDSKVFKSFTLFSFSLEFTIDFSLGFTGKSLNLACLFFLTVIQREMYSFTPRPTPTTTTLRHIFHMLT